MSLERGSRTIGLMAKRALNLAVNQFNEEVGNKIQIRLYIENDDYIPNLAKHNVIKFVNDQIKYLILPVGSPTILSYIDSLDKNDFAILYPLTGSLPIRNKKYTNLALFRASLDDEAKVLIRTVYRDFGAKKFALFYQDDGVGTHGPFEAALKELEAVGITNTAIITYTRGSTNFENQVKELFEAQPDALGFFSNAQSSREFIRQAGILKLANMKLFGVSFIGEAPLKRFIKRLGIDILFGAVVPNPQKSELPIVKEYRTLMDTINSNYDVYSLEAYISSKILIEAIKHTKLPITPKKIIKHMESFKNYDFHGIKLNFNPETRCISKHMWLESSSNDEWPRYSLTTKEPD
ncbi:MAG: Receptor family ligand binding region [bacterium ADurb.BinA186]|nr:MAG: Receptor family ligand binding region [bacterium ADurb.BinA186]